MSEAPNAEAEQTETDARTRRANNQRFTLTELPNGHYNIRNDTANAKDDDSHTYTVHVEDADVEKCTCPDHKYRDVTCKHMKRVQKEMDDDDSIPRSECWCADHDLPCFDHFEME